MTYPIDMIRDLKAEELMAVSKQKKDILEDLRSLINRYSLENDSNTPDFIIAAYLFDCLVNFNKTVGQRCYWYNPEGKE